MFLKLLLVCLEAHGLRLGIANSLTKSDFYFLTSIILFAKLKRGL
ncbi:hypothetical protein GXM_07621 [Nostoc sphaeroides CCNUC1]|uniref:Uncharacterized protein n=1 Tax=Nostoc sphaeroides CCNUC1 TaxID=2653204 RepID=A0A5P8WBG5_9NOSO|nr:hypothetical protein GXM_07621 [Nostoc sphaeroides CCNUC1]